jgi:hypothetical protein
MLGVTKNSLPSSFILHPSFFIFLTTVQDAQIPKKPGFLLSLGVTTKFFRKKTRFLSLGESRTKLMTND